MLCSQNNNAGQRNSQFVTHAVLSKIISVDCICVVHVHVGLSIKRETFTSGDNVKHLYFSANI